jgi:hypothetical protein
MQFISTLDGDVKNVFLIDAWLLEQFIGITTWKQVSASQSVTLAVTYGD